ncbi:hypothetical protein J4480_01595 [Candidatus Woesearchaeota archaeon]|nr:hypothetical protein [Candidatus Woesearchaeota archaeon]
MQVQSSKSFRHLARHLFVVSGVYSERGRARQELDSYLQRMRKSIIRMTLGYSDIEKLKKKVDSLVDIERKYAKFFKPEDKETEGLKNQINALEHELMNEREEKYRIASDNNEKIQQLTNSLNSIKVKMNELLVEKSKRHQRLTALDQKIRAKVDVRRYYNS